ncbi:hypothetical protein [Halopelagius fulvigenes]|uniref:Uncharacterized protein n=1 Tax=Halopelagius fulvigenes TaxID=1198324 RepID=A0ABD5TXG6_9EURY
MPNDNSGVVNRRRLLQLVGGTTVGLGLWPGAASARAFTFDGCETVRTDTDGNFAVVDTGDGYEGRELSSASRHDTPWSHDQTFCYTAADGEKVVGFIEENRYRGTCEGDSCTLHVNPNDCTVVGAREILERLDGDTVGICDSVIEPACNPSLPQADWVDFARTYVNERNASAQSLVQTADRGFALTGWRETANGEQDVYLVVTDGDGNVTFSRTYGGEQTEVAYDIVETSDGGFALAGLTTSFGAGDYDAWLVTTDQAGDIVFTETYGDDKRDRAKAVVQTADGGFALGGDTISDDTGSSDFWLVKTDETGDEEFSRTYGGELSETANAMVQTSDGGFALAGTTLSFGSGGNDFWLLKTDEEGNKEFAEAFGGEGLEVASSLVQTSDGGFALAGSTTSFDQGGGDFWLVKTDETGNEEFTRTYGGDELDLADAVVQTDERGFVLAGFTESFGVESSDIFLVTTNAIGETMSERTYGGCGDDRARSLVQTADCGYALAVEVVGQGRDRASEIALVKTVADLR